MKSLTFGNPVQNTTPTALSTKPSTPLETLQPVLIKHLLFMRYQTDQVEYARYALNWYADLMKDFPEIDLFAGVTK